MEVVLLVSYECFQKKKIKGPILNCFSSLQRSSAEMAATISCGAMEAAKILHGVRKYWFLAVPLGLLGFHPYVTCLQMLNTPWSSWASGELQAHHWPLMSYGTRGSCPAASEQAALIGLRIGLPISVSLFGLRVNKCWTVSRRNCLVSRQLNREVLKRILKPGAEVMVQQTAKRSYNGAINF